MGDIEKPGQVRSLEWVLAESACREIIQSKIDSTDCRGGEDPTTIGRVFAKHVEYTYSATSPARGETFTGTGEELAARYAAGQQRTAEQQFRHLVTNIQFTLVDATHARARSTLTTFRLSDPDPLGVDCIEEMLDEFVLEDDGAWRLSKRVNLAGVDRRHFRAGTTPGKESVAIQTLISS